MYIGHTQTDRQARSAKTTLGNGALGESPALSPDAFKRAVSVNRVYARAIGWMQYTRQIAARLGITAKNPDIWSFVQALADWQGRNMMKRPDGILRGEWYDLLTRKR
jgi:hypothetical protein